MVRVEVLVVKKLGLEVWQVWAADKFNSEFLSEEKANSHAAKLQKSLRKPSNEHTKSGSKVSTHD